MSGMRLVDVTARIHSVEQLHAVVTAMRGIAAERSQQCRALLTGIGVYGATISTAISETLGVIDARASEVRNKDQGQLGLVLFCAEQGFAGAYSERVFDHVASDVEKATLFVVGTRGKIIANERGLSIAWTTPMAAQIGAVTATALRVADAIFGHIETGKLRRFDLVVHKTTPDGGRSVERRPLIPVPLARFAPPRQTVEPVITLGPNVLLQRLIAEYVFAELCEAVTRNFAAESERRMEIMTSAKMNIEDAMRDLTMEAHRIWQEETTAEVVELAAGSEAAKAIFNEGT